MSKAFKKDLVAGEASEKILMDMVRRSGKTPMKPEGLFSLYDFFVCETKLAYEVKRDWKSAHTGNVVIEIEMPVGTPSGLQTTIADYWVFDLPGEFVLARPGRLKDMLAFERIGSSCEFVGNGDSTMKRAYLVEVNILKKYSDGVYKKKNENK